MNMKVSSIEKVLNAKESSSWANVRDAVSDIVRKRKVNANIYVSAGKSNSEGVIVYLYSSENKVEKRLCEVVVKHGEKKLINPVVELLEKFGYKVEK